MASWQNYFGKQKKLGKVGIKQHTHFVSNASEEIPDYLKSTCAMLRGAYPDGLTHQSEDYFVMLCILHEAGFTFRAIAYAIAVCFNLDYYEVLYDTPSLNAELPPETREKINRVIARLALHGYQQWLEEED